MTIYYQGNSQYNQQNPRLQTHLHIHLEWVLGHMNIEGNEQADKAAKAQQPHHHPDHHKNEIGPIHINSIHDQSRMEE